MPDSDEDMANEMNSSDDIDSEELSAQEDIKAEARAIEIVQK